MQKKLNVEKFKKRGHKIKIGDNEYKLSDFDTQKNDILEEIGNVKYNDLKDLVYRMQLTYDEIMGILNLKYISTKRTGYSLNPGIYEVVDLNNSLKRILLDNVKVSGTIDDVRFKTNSKTNQTLIFTEKSFFYTILGFTRSQSYPIDDINGFYQLIAGSYKSDKPINITRIDKIPLNVIVYKVVFKMVYENLFCTVLPCVHHQVEKYTRDQASNISKR